MREFSRVSFVCFLASASFNAFLLKAFPFRFSKKDHQRQNQAAQKCKHCDDGCYKAQAVWQQAVTDLKNETWQNQCENEEQDELSCSSQFSQQIPQEIHPALFALQLPVQEFHSRFHQMLLKRFAANTVALARIGHQLKHHAALLHLCHEAR